MPVNQNRTRNNVIAICLVAVVLMIVGVGYVYHEQHTISNVHLTELLPAHHWTATDLDNDNVTFGSNNMSVNGHNTGITLYNHTMSLNYPNGYVILTLKSRNGNTYHFTDTKESFNGNTVYPHGKGDKLTLVQK